MIIILLNPFDSRCANWDLWSEALTAADFENMAESAIPQTTGENPFWVNAPRTIFGSAAYTMQDDDDRSLSKLLRLLMVEDLSQLQRYLVNTEAASLADERAEKTALNIRSILTTNLKPFRFLADLDQSDKPPFAIRDWVNNETEQGWLFISSNANEHAAMRPLISMWIAMASLSLLSLPENPDRRIWFIVDELPALHRLPQLAETLAEVRKFGGCFVLGMQSRAQLEKIYGPHESKAIFDLLKTRFFFCSPSADVAKMASIELGEQEVEESREQYSYGANTIRDGISIGRHRTARQLVTYSEIMSLQNLECYIRFPGNHLVTKLQLKHQEREKIEEALTRRDIKPDHELEEAIKETERWKTMDDKGHAAAKQGQIPPPRAKRQRSETETVSDDTTCSVSAQPARQATNTASPEVIRAVFHASVNACTLSDKSVPTSTENIKAVQCTTTHPYSTQKGIKTAKKHKEEKSSIARNQQDNTASSFDASSDRGQTINPLSSDKPPLLLPPPADSTVKPLDKPLMPDPIVESPLPNDMEIEQTDQGNYQEMTVDIEDRLL